MNALVLIAFMLVAPLASAVEARDLRGLAVVVEHIAEPIAVDGVAMHIQRLQGRDIRRLAQRIEERWRAERSPIQQSAHNGWQIRSRWVGLHSEVIQWRQTGEQAELVFSWFDVSLRPEPPAAAPVALPPRCMWIRSIAGKAAHHRYRQMTARCRVAPAQLAHQLESTLMRHDWAVVHRSNATWDLARRHERARVSLMSVAADGESAMVWLVTAQDVEP